MNGLRRLLACWSDERFFPVRPREDFTPLLLVISVNKLDREAEAAFREIYLHYTKLHSIFRDCIILDAGLEGDRDLYARGENVAKGRYGNKAGPNFQFFETMGRLTELGGFTFQCEIDCFPLRPGWLNDLNDLIDDRRFAWVIGSIYVGQHPVARDIQMHFNGNAIYQTGNKDFVNFVNNIWRSRVLEFVDIDPNLAYDCWWALESSRASRP